MLILLLCFYMLVAHWFACIWYSIGRTDSENYLTYSWLWKLGNVTQVRTRQLVADHAPWHKCTVNPNIRSHALARFTSDGCLRKQLSGFDLP
mgnify:CR=1 FL=1